MPGQNFYIVPKDPSSGTPLIPLGGIFCGFNADQSGVKLGVPPTSGVGAAPVVRVSKASRPDETVTVAVVEIPRPALRPNPLASWGVNYLEFGPQDRPDIFQLIAAVNTLEEDPYTSPVESPDEQRQSATSM